MDKEDLMKKIKAGEISLLDPLRPQKYHNSLRSRVANLVARFDTYIQSYPGGFVLDKAAVLAALEKDHLTPTIHTYFKQYGYRVTSRGKKPYIRVERWKPKHENSNGRGKPDTEHELRDTE